MSAKIVTIAAFMIACEEAVFERLEMNGSIQQRNTTSGASDNNYDRSRGKAVFNRVEMVRG